MTNHVTESSLDPNARLLIDVDNTDALPKRFRMSSATVDGDPQSLPDLKGLSNLRISGSGMFSQRGLQAMKREIGDEPIIVVDLRQESHGAVNGMAVSWYGTHNGTNKGQPKEEVQRIEGALLAKLSQSPSISFDKLEGKSIDLGEDIKDPKSVQTEEEMVRGEGVDYKRFFVTDHHRPLDEVVDEFITWTKALPENAWLHFHCRGGVGRTSTFMNMYDMMQHAGEVSFEHIMLRHVLIGGKDFKADPKEQYKVAPAIDRIQFIEQFYNYCLDCKADGFNKSWSEWVAEGK